MTDVPPFEAPLLHFKSIHLGPENTCVMLVGASGVVKIWALLPAGEVVELPTILIAVTLA